VAAVAVAADLPPQPGWRTTWKVKANPCEIAGFFETRINQAFFNAKGQRVKGTKKNQQNQAFDPLTLCPFVLI
jgi:hypothetical protein